MWRVHQKELELDDRLKGRMGDDSTSGRRQRDSSDSQRSTNKRHSRIDTNASDPCSSSKRVIQDSYAREDEGLKDDIDEFLHSRVNRGRGDVGSLMDEAGLYLPSCPDSNGKQLASPDVGGNERWKHRVVLGPQKPSSLRCCESSEESSLHDKQKKAKKVDSSKQHSRKHKSKSKEKSRDKKKKKREEKRYYYVKGKLQSSCLFRLHSHLYLTAIMAPLLAPSLSLATTSLPSSSHPTSAMYIFNDFTLIAMLNQAIPCLSLTCSLSLFLSGLATSNSTLTRCSQGYVRGIKEWNTGGRMDIQFDSTFQPVGDQDASLNGQLGQIVHNGTKFPLICRYRLKTPAIGSFVAHFLRWGRHTSHRYNIKMSIIGNSLTSPSPSRRHNLGIFRHMGGYASECGVQTWCGPITCIPSFNDGRDHSTSLGEVNAGAGLNDCPNTQQMCEKLKRELWAELTTHIEQMTN